MFIIGCITAPFKQVNGPSFMIQFARRYIHIVDTVNRRLGRVMMYSIFVMVGILLWSSISKTFFPALVVDSRNCSVRYGCLLHSWGSLFHPVGGKCPNGFVLQWLDYSQKGSGRCHHCTFFNFLSWGNCCMAAGTASAIR